MPGTKVEENPELELAQAQLASAQAEPEPGAKKLALELELAQAQLAAAQAEPEPRAKKTQQDKTLACTGNPDEVAKEAKALRIVQQSNNKEVVWIVANGWKKGIYMTLDAAKAQWHHYPKGRYCGMNRQQFEAGEHLVWYTANYGLEECPIKPDKGRKRKAAADESTDEDE